MNQDQVMKRYYKEFSISMAAYAIILIASITISKQFYLPQLAKIVVVLVPMIPIIFVIIAIMRALRDSDELQQRVQLNAITFSAIATGLITFSYGFLENIGFSKFPTIWILPIMLLLWGLSLGYFWKKYQ
jgi:ABC-type transport system involved in cytochrome bd biosynthesis fused ATPase/permease subunit